MSQPPRQTLIVDEIPFNILAMRVKELMAGKWVGLEKSEYMPFIHLSSYARGITNIRGSIH